MLQNFLAGRDLQPNAERAGFRRGLAARPRRSGLIRLGEIFVVDGDGCFALFAMPIEVDRLPFVHHWASFAIFVSLHDFLSDDLCSCLLLSESGPALDRELNLRLLRLLFLVFCAQGRAEFSFPFDLIVVRTHDSSPFSVDLNLWSLVCNSQRTDHVLLQFGSDQRLLSQDFFVVFSFPFHLADVGGTFGPHGLLPHRPRLGDLVARFLTSLLGVVQIRKSGLEFEAFLLVRIERIDYVRIDAGDHIHTIVHHVVNRQILLQIFFFLIELTDLCLCLFHQLMDLIGIFWLKLV